VIKGAGDMEKERVLEKCGDAESVRRGEAKTL